jgi:murein L,D-transpeptidase YafK
MLLSTLVLLTLVARPTTSPGPCASLGSAILVQTAAHALTLCEAGQTGETFRVALGTGGVGKQRQGDAKVPLGTYPLGTPRASSSFGTFILIGYPTPAQRRAGFTGSAVGVHGPLRSARLRASEENTAFDWTLGCIAVGSDDEIERIAAWVREKRVTRIVIRE